MSRLKHRLKLHRRNERSVQEWHHNRDALARAVSGYDVAERIAAEAARRTGSRSAA